ncbi:MAG: alpha/beta hydrolase [Pseudomonadales bacterium]|nr:alpha/beta hydrolase [Pseudomonadales bacterium]
MAANGWICVSVDYRLSPAATFPAHIIDCKQAFSWVKDNIEAYGGNPDFVAITGGSAGGHLSSLFALTPNDPKFQPGFEDVDTTVQGCIPYYGIYDLSDTYALHGNSGLYTLISKYVLKKPKETNREEYFAGSPMHRVHENAPPFFVLHGTSDTATSFTEAQRFVQELRKVSKNSVAFAEIPGAQHAFDIFPSVRSEYSKLAVERFANVLYSEYLVKQQEITEQISKLGKIEKV